MLMWWRISLVIATVGLTAPLARADDKVDFNRGVRPILSDNCFACHGPDAAKRKADLRLDTRDGLFNELDGNFPIIPGNPGKSEVYLRLIADDEGDRMPPKKANKTLTKQQIDLIKKWIEQGAEFHVTWRIPPWGVVPRPDNDFFVECKTACDRFSLKINPEDPGSRGATGSLNAEDKKADRLTPTIVIGTKG